MIRSFLMLFMLLLTIDANADNTSFWRNADQQGDALLQQGDASAAAEVFTDPRRKAYANIQAGKYREAAADLANFRDSESNYNRGNALAYEGDLQAALDAYDAALKDDPNHADARHNRELVAKALEQQSSQQSDSSDEQQNDESRDKQQNNKDQDKQDQNQQSQDSSGSGQDEQNGKENQDKQDQSGQEESDQDERQDSAQNSTNEKQKQGTQDKQSSSEKSDAEKPDAGKTGSGQNKPSQGQDKQTSQAELDKQKDDNGQYEQESAASKQAQQENAPDQTGKRQPASAADDTEQARRDAEASLALSGKQNKTGSDKGDQNIQADEPLTEKQLALDQWLRNIPDDPGGLLRRKFLIEHMMRQQNLRP